MLELLLCVREYELLSLGYDLVYILYLIPWVCGPGQNCSLGFCCTLHCVVDAWYLLAECTRLQRYLRFYC